LKESTWIILIITIKWISYSIPFMLFGYSSNESLKIGSGMISISEVALIILSMGLTAKVLDKLMYSMMVVSFIVVNILSSIIMNLIFKKSESSWGRRKFYHKIFK
jgi:Kef-type K+ transport system membrane component KefB